MRGFRFAVLFAAAGTMGAGAWACGSSSGGEQGGAPDGSGQDATSEEQPGVDASEDGGGGGDADATTMGDGDATAREGGNEGGSDSGRGSDGDSGSVSDSGGGNDSASDGGREGSLEDGGLGDSGGGNDGPSEASDASFDWGDGSVVEVPRTIAAGSDYSCAIVDGGGIRCWGDNSNGQLGNGIDGGTSAIPVDVAGITGAVEVAAGSAHACARLADGTARCWGSAFMLGDGDAGPSTVPVPVSGLTNAVQIVAGSYHSCALRADHHVVCWGSNSGRIGDGTSTDRLVPTEPVGPITDAIAVGAGWGHTCIVHAAGTITCSGEYNAWGQLGDGTKNDSLVPVNVLHVSTAVFVSLGLYSSYAVLQDGTIAAWGNNQTGQLGIGSQDQSAHTATPVPGLASVAQMKGGGFGACAVTSAQVPYCWGDGTEGVVPVSDSPTVVSGLGPTLETAVGEGHICARLATGQVMCWGNNNAGQLGSADAGASSATPVVVQGL